MAAYTHDWTNAAVVAAESGSTLVSLGADNYPYKWNLAVHLATVYDDVSLFAIDDSSVFLVMETVPVRGHLTEVLFARLTVDALLTNNDWSTEAYLIRVLATAVAIATATATETAIAIAIATATGGTDTPLRRNFVVLAVNESIGNYCASAVVVFSLSFETIASRMPPMHSYAIVMTKNGTVTVVVVAVVVGDDVFLVLFDVAVVVR